MHLKYGQSFVHQNNLSIDIIFFTNTVRLHFCTSDRDRYVFHGDMIIVIRVFHHFTTVKKELFSVDKNPLVPTMTLCFKAVSCCKYGG